MCCDICNNDEKTVKVCNSIELCDKCLDIISYVCQFKNIDNATDEEKVYVSKFLNLISNKLLKRRK